MRISDWSSDVCSSDLVSRNSSEVAAMNDPLANFDQIDDDLQEDRQRRARAAFVAAPGRSPDEAARANRLADHRGLPFGVVAENLPEFEERDRLDEIESVSRRNPALGEFRSEEHTSEL